MCLSQERGRRVVLTMIKKTVDGARCGEYKCRVPDRLLLLLLRQLPLSAY